MCFTEIVHYPFIPKRFRLTSPPLYLPKRNRADKNGGETGSVFNTYMKSPVHLNVVKIVCHVCIFFNAYFMT